MAAEDFVLITGSSGLIGHALCHKLGSEGMQVIGFDRDGPPFPPPKADCIFCDLSSNESVQNAMFMVEQRYGKRLRAVVHLAAYYNFAGGNDKRYCQVNVEGTRRLLKELKRFEVGQFIYSGSMLVYAPSPPGQRIDEQSPLSASWAYPRSKIMAEREIEIEQGTMPAVVLQIAGVYTDLCQSIPIAHQIQRIYERQFSSHFYPGSLNTRQSFVHVDDVLNAIALSMERRSSLGHHNVMLIGEPEALSYGELQDEIGELIYNRDWATMQIPELVAKGGAWLENVIPLMRQHAFIKPWMIEHADDNYVLDIAKARRELGWEPHYSLKESLPKMIEGLLEDPVLFYELNKLEMPSWIKRKASKRKLKVAA